MSKKVSRRQLREKALQTLFQLSCHEELSVTDALNSVLELHDDKEEDCAFTLAEVPYLSELVNGIVTNKVAIDSAIQEQLENWSFTRITKVDLAILRIGAYELLFAQADSVPSKVAINEAIELAKLYSDDKAPKFINGILSNLLKQIDAKG